MLTARSSSIIVALLLVGTASACADDSTDAMSDGSRPSFADAGAQFPGSSSGSSDAGGMYSSDPSSMSSSSGGSEIAQQGSSKPVENDFVDTSKETTSTFGVDVDTASYTLMRTAITSGSLPLQTSIRPEEYINYFTYAYPQPTDAHPFSVNIDAAPSKFGDNLHLLRIGLQGKIVTAAERKPMNLVFLIDTSGSMQAANKLSLVKYTLKKLTEQLRPSDTLGIVTYAGVAGTLLEPTSVTDKAKILGAIDGLASGGSTNGAGGIYKAYELAEKNKTQYTESRVVLCTDGDFNVGATGDALVNVIVEKREKGVTLTTLGFGSGNYNDTQMESLADKGNGNYAYIDTEREADKVVGIKLAGTLQVIAKDVKIQVALDPAFVTRYRLIGYENRVLANQDFTDDKKDAGEIGAGHSVTAFYEIELTPAAKAGTAQGDLAKVSLRYKQPQGDVSTELSKGFPLSSVAATFDAAAADFRFGASVVELAEILRHSKHSTGARFDDVISIAESTSNQDDARLELVELTKNAKTLSK